MDKISKISNDYGRAFLWFIALSFSILLELFLFKSSAISSVQIADLEQVPANLPEAYIMTDRIVQFVEMVFEIVKLGS